MNAMKLIGLLLIIASIGLLVNAQTNPASGNLESSSVASKGKGNPIVSLLTCILNNVGNLLGISVGGIVKDLGHLISSDGSFDLSGLLSGLTSILNIPLDSIFSALRSGNISQLSNILQPLVDQLLHIPLIGSVLSLVANVLQVNFDITFLVLIVYLYFDRKKMIWCFRFQFLSS